MAATYMVAAVFYPIRPQKAVIRRVHPAKLTARPQSKGRNSPKSKLKNPQISARVGFKFVFLACTAR